MKVNFDGQSFSAEMNGMGQQQQPYDTNILSKVGSCFILGALSLALAGVSWAWIVSFPLLMALLFGIVGWVDVVAVVFGVILALISLVLGALAIVQFVKSKNSRHMIGTSFSWEMIGLISTILAFLSIASLFIYAVVIAVLILLA